jgi:hypothetical protein
MNCELCNQPAAYNHCNHETGKLQNICNFHYSKFHGRTVINEVKNMQKCYLCKDMAKLLEHHICYFPQIIIFVCDTCHKKIHSGKYPELQPKNRRHQLIFYAHKGHLVFQSYKNQKRIPINHYDKTRKEGYIWCNSRPLTEKEKFLRKEMFKTKPVYLPQGEK